ncbi:MAG: type II secretion system protein GspK [Sandaracinaceae bacterium]|nr:type II secretion system protein GspK [Sandaracinaceae bacterium]
MRPPSPPSSQRLSTIRVAKKPYHYHPMLPPQKRRGIALVMAMITLAILTVTLADMQQTTLASFLAATTERDRLRAEFMAKSGLNLTRLLVAQEPVIRNAVTPTYQLFLGRPPPQLPVWAYADLVFRPFCKYSESIESGLGSSLLLGAEGLGETHAECEILAFAENSRINLNDPLFFDGDRARTSVAMQFFALMGGYQSPSPFDPLFEGLDPDGQHSTRQDIVSALIDWWDYDTERTNFDPGGAKVTVGGPEEDIYLRFDDPYRPKNAPFDSLEEIRLIRGIGDDFWATFIEPDPEHPERRLVTIYGSGSVNPNEAPPQVLLARVCSVLTDQSLCTDPMEAARFIQLITTLRMLAPIPFFSSGSDFLTFLEGGGGPRDLYPMLLSFLGQDNPLLFKPVRIRPEQRQTLEPLLVTGAKILSINVTGRSGRAVVKLKTVMNFHERWTPPPPNAGTMPGLGIFYYYRIE